MNPVSPLCQNMCAAVRPPVKPGFGWLASVALSLPLMLLTVLFIFYSPNKTPGTPGQTLAAGAIVWVVLNGLFLAMLKTGRTDRYRTVLFVATAIAFGLTFIPNLLAARGSMIIERSDVVDGRLPMCHIVIPMLLIPAALKQTIIFPGSLIEGFASIGSMLVLWLGASLALGRGWCSWVCFYGGYDEGVSRLGAKSWIKRLDRRWTYLPVAILLTVVLTSAAILSPTYCEWVCPFRAVSEFDKVVSLKYALQAVIFVGLFIGFVIVLPFLTKKRTQCSFLCPMGVFQGWTNHLAPHRVAIDPDRCTRCGLCVRNCPTLSLTTDSVAAGRTLSSCTRCGRCLDVCPRSAVSFHVKGTRLFARPRLARLLFLYPAMILLSAVGGSMMVGAVIRILKFCSTGSLL